MNLSMSHIDEVVEKQFDIPPHWMAIIGGFQRLFIHRKSALYYICQKREAIPIKESGNFFLCTFCHLCSMKLLSFISLFIMLEFIDMHCGYLENIALLLMIFSML